MEKQLDKKMINRKVGIILEELKEWLNLDTISDVRLSNNMAKVYSILLSKNSDSYPYTVWSELLSYLYGDKIIVENEYELTKMISNKIDNVKSCCIDETNFSIKE